jgi:hypothetical protein
VKTAPTAQSLKKFRKSWGEEVSEPEPKTASEPECLSLFFFGAGVGAGALVVFRFHQHQHPRIDQTLTGDKLSPEHVQERKTQGLMPSANSWYADATVGGYFTRTVKPPTIFERDELIEFFWDTLLLSVSR